MPRYDYQCPECRRILEEVIQGIKDDRKAICLGYIALSPDDLALFPTYGDVKEYVEAAEASAKTLGPIFDPAAEVPTKAPEHKPAEMTKLIGNAIFQKLGSGWPDKDGKELKERFQKRNKRIEAMQPWQQEAFKKIIDSTGGRRYIP